MKKGDELTVLFPDERKRRWCKLRVDGQAKNGAYRCTWLTGPLARGSGEALIDGAALREMRDAK